MPLRIFSLTLLIMPFLVQGQYIKNWRLYINHKKVLSAKGDSVQTVQVHENDTLGEHLDIVLESTPDWDGCGEYGACNVDVFFERTIECSLLEGGPDVEQRCDRGFAVRGTSRCTESGSSSA